MFIGAVLPYIVFNNFPPRIPVFVLELSLRELLTSHLLSCFFSAKLGSLTPAQYKSATLIRHSAITMSRDVK